MSKCICKQIAEIAEKNGWDRVKVCTARGGVCAQVDCEATKNADGILIIKNANVKHDCGCEHQHKSVDWIGISGRYIVSFRCGDEEI